MLLAGTVSFTLWLVASPVVALLETEDHRILSGSACRLVQEMQSVVRATLDAINRNLEKHLLTM